MTAHGNDITIIMATYNRAEQLRETLECMSRLDRTGLSVEFVIVNNNSIDRTEAVVNDFTKILPIQYLVEHKQDKNCVLNRALKDV